MNLTDTEWEDARAAAAEEFTAWQAMEIDVDRVIGRREYDREMERREFTDFECWLDNNGYSHLSIGGSWTPARSAALEAALAKIDAQFGKVVA